MHKCDIRFLKFKLAQKAVLTGTYDPPESPVARIYRNYAPDRI